MPGSPPRTPRPACGGQLGAIASAWRFPAAKVCGLRHAWRMAAMEGFGDGHIPAGPDPPRWPCSSCWGQSITCFKFQGPPTRGGCQRKGHASRSMRAHNVGQLREHRFPLISASLRASRGTAVNHAGPREAHRHFAKSCTNLGSMLTNTPRPSPLPTCWAYLFILPAQCCAPAAEFGPETPACLHARTLVTYVP